MKMSYEHRSNIRNNRVPITVKILSLGVLFIFIIYFFFPNFLSRVLTSVAGMFWSSDVVPSESDKYISMELHDSIISELKSENDELRSILHGNVSSKPMILAYIVKKPPQTAYDSYIVDIGTNDVQIGDKVYALGNVLIGEIYEVNSGFAKVKLYSTQGEKYSVSIGKDNIHASAIGVGGGAFETVLPKDVKIVVGDIVTVPDKEISVFGIVRDVTVDPARSFSTILFSQPVNIYELKWVQIN